MTVDPKHIMSLQGRDFIKYEGLLDEAHQQGLKFIETELLQIPTDQNGKVAICKAVVETGKGRFSGIGDANPGNVNKNIATHIIRMAETRAKARALRDATNIGMTAYEELSEDGDTDGGQKGQRATSAPAALTPEQAAARLKAQDQELGQLIRTQGAEERRVMEGIEKQHGVWDALAVAKREELLKKLRSANAAWWAKQKAGAA